ncbi:MAG: cellulase family glycosylhydrolase [Ardenticatenia bacterium]|nr:cellulase family glycosylhydrolase [Ardenticatenia bacterium]
MRWFLLLLVIGCRLMGAPDAPSPTVGPVSTAFELIFASDRGGAGGLYVLDDDGQARPLVQSPAGVWDPALSPDGYRLVYTDYAANNGDIVVVNADGTGRQVLTDHPADDYWPAWSPDGVAVAFVSERDGGQDLYLVRLDECRRPDHPCPARRLAASSPLALHKYPAWAPDGTLVFSGVDAAGLEALYRLDLASDAVVPLVGPEGLVKGTMPAVGPDGAVAFVTWEALPSERTLALWLPTEQQVRSLVRAGGWLGHPSWTPDGRAVLFAMWNGTSHDLYVVSREGGKPTQLTANVAWDDTPTARPASMASSPEVSDSTDTPSGPRTRVWWGANVARFDQAYLMHDLGLTWLKGFVDWARVEPEPGRYEWRDVELTVREAERVGAKLLLRIHNAPAWARPPDSPPNTPPQSPDALAHFVRALGTRYRGRVHAYEFWNEPNLAFEWGGQWPEPARYAELVSAVWSALRGVDEKALLVVGGLAVTGEGSELAVGDLDYARAFYAAVEPGTFDAFGLHPYGFGRPPGAPPEQGLGVRRAEAHRRLMVAAGLEQVPIWFTEMGWVLDAPGWNLGEHEYGALPFALQARYWADGVTLIEEWPWVQAAFIFNLDFSTAPWYPAGEQMRWYALLNPDGSPRPAYTALRSRLRR